jgi:ribosomal protein S18 acetylase RimI-like enzyme
MEKINSIKKAMYEDLVEILDLQKLVFLSEAKLLNDYSIQPLTQTLAELQNEFVKFDKGIILKLIDDENNQIIGSVRAYEINDRVYIGKLIVHPDHQNKGFGTDLLKAIETYFENKIFELYTSNKSEKNLYLYKKSGYKEFKREKTAEGYDFVFLEK